MFTPSGFWAKFFVFKIVVSVEMVCIGNVKISDGMEILVVSGNRGFSAVTLEFWASQFFCLSRANSSSNVKTSTWEKIRNSSSSWIFKRIPSFGFYAPQYPKKIQLLKINFQKRPFASILRNFFSSLGKKFWKSWFFNEKIWRIFKNSKIWIC